VDGRQRSVARRARTTRSRLKCCVVICAFTDGGGTGEYEGLGHAEEAFFLHRAVMKHVEPLPPREEACACKEIVHSGLARHVLPHPNGAPRDESSLQAEGKQCINGAIKCGSTGNHLFRV